MEALHVIIYWSGQLQSEYSRYKLRLVRVDIINSSQKLCRLPSFTLATSEISRLLLPVRLTVHYTAHGSCFPLLWFHPESCGLWWWRWCWPQTCPATSSRWRPWRISYNSRRGQFPFFSLTAVHTLCPPDPAIYILINPAITSLFITTRCLQPN